MKVLVTGNQGYIGSVLTELLLEKGHQVVGLDTNFYHDCWLFKKEKPRLNQIRKDIRQITKKDLEGIEAIIHLAALSNDVLCDLNPEATYEINYQATIDLATLAKKIGISRFVFSSSQSMYGIAKKGMVTEDSAKDPFTDYARSKLLAEESLAKIADDNFTPVFLRPSTVAGISPKLRLDIVLNNLVAWGFTTGKIRIMSDGSPWRPTIHVEDISQAFIAALEAPRKLVHNQAFNVGKNQDNYRIREMAEEIEKILTDCQIEYTYEHGLDSRTYKVSFDKINSVLGDSFKPQWPMGQTIKELAQGFKANGLKNKDLKGTRFTRLNQMKKLLEEKSLDFNLFWQQE